MAKQHCQRMATQFLAHAREKNPIINAFTSQLPADVLLTQATAADARIADGQDRPLEGALIAVKDNFCTRDLLTTCASEALKGFSSPFDATVVERLRNNGAIVHAKTNMDEFGMGSASIFSAHGPVRHPMAVSDTASVQERDDAKLRSAGGSSGGSAAAVAAGLCHAALGSDTGGSVRLPAAYCGVVGMKPSYGLCSRRGLVGYASSLDTVGILARTVHDSAQVLAAMLDNDPRDASSLPSLMRSSVTLPRQTDLSGVVVGIPKEYFVQELESSIVDAWKGAADVLCSLGARIEHVSCPYTRHALGAYYIIAPAEASSNMARFDGNRYGSRPTETPGVDMTSSQVRRACLGEEVQRRVLLGSYVLSESAYDDHFVRAQRIRRLVVDDFNRCFRTQRSNTLKESTTGTGVDILLTPCNITTAPYSDSLLAARNIDSYVSDVMTVPASLAGIPALSLPFTRSNKDGYPIGVQLLAQYGNDEMLLRVAAALESASQ